MHGSGAVRRSSGVDLGAVGNPWATNLPGGCVNCFGWPTLELVEKGSEGCGQVETVGKKDPKVEKVAKDLQLSGSPLER